MKLIFCIQINMKVPYKLILRFLMGTARNSQSSQNSKFAMSLQYGIRKLDNVDFLHADKHQNLLQVDFNTLGIKFSYRVTLSLLMGIIKLSQSTQSNKFAISLQYLRKEVRDGVYSLHANKHQFLQVGMIVFDGSGQTCPNYPKWEVGNIFAIS